VRLLEVRNLGVIYRSGRGYVEALSGVDLYVEKGEVLGLVGESGSGKTTLGLAIMRLLPQNARITSGSIVFEGVDLLRCSEVEMARIRGRRISMVFQDPYTSFNPVSRIKDHFIELFRAHIGDIDEEEILDRSRHLLETVGVPPDRLNAYPHQLSGGQRQRVAIALAIALNPSLVIADEPTSSLDVLVEAQIVDLFRELREKQGISMIFITHNLALIAELADRVAVMYAGKVVEVTGAREVFRKPLHPYTQALIASIPTIGGERVSKPIPGEPPSLSNPPKGCRFHPRCPFAMEICRTREPELRISGGSYVACHLY